MMFFTSSPGIAGTNHTPLRGRRWLGARPQLPLKMLLLLTFLLFSLQPIWAANESEPEQETMLMFVGEELPVTTVASRLPEAPSAAPAMVTVIGREEIERRGYQTLADLLAQQSGFYMAPRGRGTASYLRGLPDSILFLYDGVPITTDVTKNLGMLDREISLVAIDRVEISRGPGSILWGADAFAGVVNIVPLRGRQRPGVETGLLVGSDPLQGATATWGLAHQKWDTFLSLAGDREQYYNQDFTIRKTAGQAVQSTIDPSEHREAVATLNYGDWLHVIGRWSDFTRRYTMQNTNGSLSWPGEKEAPLNLLKATVSKVVGPSHYTLTGFLQEINYRVQDADVERSQQNRMNHLELLWDRRLFSRGLLTAGASSRWNMVDGAVVRDGFLPDFLVPSLPLFVPRVRQEDFSNELVSAFVQARYQWGSTEWWAGGRLDEHSQYGVAHSYSLGFNRPLTETIRVKATYGNAYRSPYSSQLFDDLQFDPESILTASGQLSWTPEANCLLELTLFQSQLEEHRTEDPYGGLSQPSAPDVQGVELAGRFPWGEFIEVNAGVTALAQNSDQENFKNLRFSFIRPDGSQVAVFEEWTEPFDQGPQWLANLGLNWRIGPDHNLLVSGRITDRVEFSYEKGSVEGSYSQPLLVDLTYRRPGFKPEHDTLTLTVTNLLDREYQLPDTFGPTVGPPLRASLVWQYRY